MWRDVADLDDGSAKRPKASAKSPKASKSAQKLFNCQKKRVAGRYARIRRGNGQRAKVISWRAFNCSNVRMQRL